jgi:tetratricopeptide (TPR) repeat protein
MPPDRWDRVQSVFLSLADLPPGEQAVLLDKECTGDDELRAEVESLLASDRPSSQVMSAAISKEAALWVDVPNLAGSRLGSWRIVREIGRGGMGTVYLAVRDDDQFQKQVAIKVVRHGMDTADVLEHFRHERQILANLDHPYIARLLDGGATPDGRPFFVMDYVEGQPLDLFCKENILAIDARCRLFLRVLEAVAHAHRNLVVHRDLKPANIFVKSDGTPKLLDFGVAKLLAADPGADVTLTVLNRPFTPQYASPEQVHGLPVTTAVDIYSLGAIFYEMLTGQRAQRIDSLSVSEIERVVCHTEVTRPSLLAKGLDADLDNIVLMAMRKEPARRYQSVDQFADDIHRFLKGRAVLARQDSFWYRARKFTGRNRFTISGAALIFVSLVAALVVTLAQARVAQSARRTAEVQRGVSDRERARAERERARAEGEHASAERRFTEVREMAGKFMFDFHDAIATLPGSTPARKMVVETGIRYYDSLLKEAGGDQALLEEIARGYDRLGDVQGNPYYPNLGDVPGAGQSYQKALAVRRQITDPSAVFQRDQVLAGVRRAQLLIVKGDIKGAEQPLQEAIAMGSRGPQAGTYEVREAVARAWSAYGDVKMRVGNFIECIAQYSKVLGIWTALAREKRDPASERAGISLAHTKLADSWSRMGRSQEALDHISIAVKIDKQLSEDDPNNEKVLRKLYIDFLVMGFMFRSAGPVKLDGPYDGASAAQSAAEIADRLAAADPDNSSRLVDIMNAQTLLGDLLRKQGDVNGALVHDRRALDAAERRIAVTGGGLDNEEALLQTRERLGEALSEAGQVNEAMENFAKATAGLASLEKENPGMPRLAERRAELLESKAEAYARAKDWQPAIEAFNEAIALVEGRRKQAPEDVLLRKELAEYSSKLAGGYAALGQWSNAARWMQSSLDALREIESRRPLLPEEEQMRRDDLTAIEAWKQK